MSGFLFKCDGQYVGFGGVMIFRVLFVIKLFNARPLVLVVLDPQEGYLELKSPPAIKLFPRDKKYWLKSVIFIFERGGQ